MVLPKAGIVASGNFANTFVRKGRRNEEARSLWLEIYPDLSEGKPGLLGAMIARWG
jgi:hypothetical protein